MADILKDFIFNLQKIKAGLEKQQLGSTNDS